MTVLDDMRDRRREALRARARDGITQRLLAEHGEVTRAAVDEAMAAEYVDPTDEQLQPQVLGKLRAAADFAVQQADVLDEAVARLRLKVEKAGRDLDAANVELREAEEVARVARRAAEEAERDARDAGAPDGVEPGEVVTAQAETAAAQTLRED